MDMLKKFFPLAFAAKKDITALVINIIIHVVIDAVAAVAIGILAKVPLVGIIVSAVGGLVGLYFLISLVLSILDYFKILK